MSISVNGSNITFSDTTTQTTAPVNTNANVNSVSAGTGISVNSTTGAVTVTNSGVTSVGAGTGISVSASTGGITITNTAPASGAGAKVWINYNGVTQTINASLGVSSVTRNGGSEYTINFSSAFSDIYYCWVAGCGMDNQGQGDWISSPLNTALTSWKTTTSLHLHNYYGYNSANADAADFNIAIFR